MNNNVPVIVGFGSQAKAWALNLKDSKVNFKIALKKNSPSHQHANQLGFNTINLESDELKNYRTYILLIPDQSHRDFFLKNEKHLIPKTHFIFAHGFSYAKEKLNEIYPNYQYSLLAPKAIASDIRFQYEIKGKIGVAYFAASTELENELFFIARNVGFTALFQSNFEEECFADLLSEQSLLCSLIPYASLKSYNLLRKNGISKEIAFMECFLELKSISEAFVKLGPEDFFKLISPNALIGSEKGKDFLINSTFDQNLNKLFEEIKSKKFFTEVEIDADELREKILNRWKNEELTETYKNLKSELI